MARLSATFFSEALSTTTHAEIIFPTRDTGGTAPGRVLYLLHGLYGGCTQWIENTRITHYAYKHNYIVIMPEAQNSFYTDMVYGAKYFTYAAHELPALIEELLNVRHTRANTYIAGLSMGGYGAAKIALNRPGFFSACAAFSGALDVAQLFADLTEKDEFHHKLAINISGEKLIIPPESNLFTLATALAPEKEKPRMLVTCGTEDFLLAANRKFDAHMKALPFDYCYKEWPGKHDWDYWEACLPVMFDFFGTAS